MQDRHFVNATGQSIPQLYHELYYTVPGLQLPSRPDSNTQNNSLLHYARKLVRLLPLELKHLLSYFTFNPTRSLQSQFGNQSLAILTNSVDLHQAILKSIQYNIPLMQIVIATPEGQQTVRSKMLLNFTVAHLINQNFVLFGDWEKHEELTLGIEEIADEQGLYDIEEGIYFRKEALVYAFLSLTDIQITHENTLQQNLIKIRNLFYQLGKQGKTSAPTLDQVIQNLDEEVNAASEQYHPNNRHSQEAVIDNFIDSEGEGEDESSVKIDPEQ